MVMQMGGIMDMAQSLRTELQRNTEALAAAGYTEENLLGGTARVVDATVRTSPRAVDCREDSISALIRVGRGVAATPMSYAVYVLFYGTTNPSPAGGVPLGGPIYVQTDRPVMVNFDRHWAPYIYAQYFAPYGNASFPMDLQIILLKHRRGLVAGTPISQMLLGIPLGSNAIRDTNAVTQYGVAGSTRSNWDKVSEMKLVLLHLDNGLDQPVNVTPQGVVLTAVSTEEAQDLRAPIYMANATRTVVALSLEQYPVHHLIVKVQATVTPTSGTFRSNAAGVLR